MRVVIQDLAVVLLIVFGLWYAVNAMMMLQSARATVEHATQLRLQQFKLSSVEWADQFSVNLLSESADKQIRWAFKRLLVAGFAAIAAHLVLTLGAQ